MFFFSIFFFVIIIARVDFYYFPFFRLSHSRNSKKTKQNKTKSRCVEAVATTTTTTVMASSSSAVQKDRQLELATQSKSKTRFEAFRRFVSEHKINPVTKEKIVVAKDLSFPRGESDDSLSVLIPLAVKEYFLYVGSYIDPKSELVEYCIRISALSDLTPNGAQHNGHAVYSFSSAEVRKNDGVRMSKGSRFAPFFAAYFDEKKNKELFRNGRSAVTVSPMVKKYDTDKEEYQDVCGYVELHHQRVPVRGKSQGFVQVISCASYKGQKKSAKLVNLLAAELPLIGEYMKFVTRVYKLDDASFKENVDERYREAGRQDVVEVLQRLDELRAKSGGSSKKDGVDAVTVGFGARKRKATGKTSKTTAVKQTHADCSNDLSAEEDEECEDARPVKSKKRTAGKNKRCDDDEKENLESVGEKRKRKTPAKNPFETGNCEASVCVDGEEEEEEEEEDGEKGKNGRLEIDCLQDEEDEEDEEDYAADENDTDGMCVQ